MSNPNQNIWLDLRLESYRGLFSDDWGQQANDAAGDATTLQTLVFELLMQWRGAAYTAEFPATLIDHFSSYVSGFLQERAPHTTVLKVADAIVARCSRDVPEVMADPAAQRKLHDEFVRIGADIIEPSGRTEFKVDREEIWKQYLQEHVYQITIWSSLRICYVAIFNAYDNFIAQLMQTITGDLAIRTTNSSFRNQLSSFLGESIKQKCWVSKDLNIIRCVRNSITHAGGRKTDHLKNVKHRVKIVDGKLQITPDDLRDEYGILKEAALAIIKHVRDKPQFKC